MELNNRAAWLHLHRPALIGMNFFFFFYINIQDDFSQLKDNMRLWYYVRVCVYIYNYQVLIQYILYIDKCPLNTWQRKVWLPTEFYFVFAN